MADHYFNTLEYARQLEAAGVTKGQAEVHANALAHVLEKCLSTAVETADLKRELSFKISELEVTLRAEIKSVEAGLARRIDRFEERMEERFRSQRFINGVIVTMLVGLYVTMAGLYLR
jgi:molybdopterin converting factor small subunit